MEAWLQHFFSGLNSVLLKRSHVRYSLGYLFRRRIKKDHRIITRSREAPRRVLWRISTMSAIFVALQYERRGSEKSFQEPRNDMNLVRA
jgi:hypothetical protein